MATVTNPPKEDDGWEDVVTETQIVFDTIGDKFEGRFTGWSETDSGIPQAHFSNETGDYFTNCGWSLKQQLKNVKTGTMVRLTYTADQDTGQKTPMRIFRVQTKK